MYNMSYIQILLFGKKYPLDGLLILEVYLTYIIFRIDIAKQHAKIPESFTHKLF